MRKIIFLLGIISFITLTSSMCEKDDDSSSSSSYNNSNILISGSWKVTYYNDSGTDKTSLFSGYHFTFNSDGSISATNNSSTLTGTWSDGMDDSQSKLYLTFTTNPFDKLTDDWHVTEKSSLKIILEDVSGGNGGTDYLTFEKI